MKTKIKTKGGYKSVDITDIELSEKQFEEIETKLDAEYKHNYDVWQGATRAENAFNTIIEYVFNISSSIEEAFKGNEDLLEKLRKAFFRNWKFKSNNSCRFSLTDYECRKEVIDKYIVEIQSYVDVITNSSSELFLVESDKTASELQAMLDSLELKEDDYYSGEGGTLEVEKVSAVKSLWSYLYEEDWDKPIDMDKIHEDFTDEELHRMDQILAKQYGFDENAKLFEVRVDYGFRSIRDFVKYTLKGQKID